MIDSITAVLHLLLAAIGVMPTPGTVTAVAVFLVAAALIATLVVAVAPPRNARSALARPRRAIDDSALISQSDPDAAGHPRSRAPGFAASAA